MFISWIAFPAAALVVCLGCGLLGDRAAGRSISPVLLLPFGGAVLVCITQVTTASVTTAPWTLPVVAAATVLGFILGRKRVAELREIGWAALAAVAVFLIAGLPVLATGTPSFAGYTVLGDTAVHFAGAAELLERGRDADSLPASNYASNYRAYYVDNAYPSGGAAVLGTLSRLVGANAAWVFQPYLSVLLGLLALAIAGLLHSVLGAPRRAALGAFVAAQPALLIAFAMQGSLKEIAVSVMLATLAAVVAGSIESPLSWRAAVPVALTAAGAVGVIGPSAAVWVGPLVLGWILLSSRGPAASRKTVLAIGAFLGVAVLASVQTLLLFDTATTAATSVASVGEVGNLLGPLNVDQALGVWLTGDFRVGPTGVAFLITRGVELLVVLATAWGVAWCVTRRSWSPLLYGGTLVLGSAFVLLRGSPWADAKALAIVSPAMLALAMIGLLGNIQRHRLVATAATMAIVVGVLASSVFVYRSASIAPHDRLDELATIAERMGTTGPTLFSEFDEFAPYFLRDVRPEPAPLLISTPGDTGIRALSDLDGMTVHDVGTYPFLITRRGPIGSRPSAAYHEVFRTKHYVAWRRADGGRPVERLPLGAVRSPQAVAACGEVRRLARVARASGGALVAAEHGSVIVVNPAKVDLPPRWRPDPADAEVTLPSGGGTAEASFDVTQPGRYAVWLESSTGRRTSVRIDGATVGVLRNQLSGRRATELVGMVDLKGGPHTVLLERLGAGLSPGGGGLFRPLGPIYLVEQDRDRMLTVEPSQWRRLCDRELDWIEVAA